MLIPVFFSTHPLTPENATANALKAGAEALEAILRFCRQAEEATILAAKTKVVLEQQRQEQLVLTQSRWVADLRQSMLQNQNSMAWTPLHIASCCADVDEVRKILFTRHPHWEYVDEVRQILSPFCTIDAQAQDGSTALEKAQAATADDALGGKEYCANAKRVVELLETFGTDLVGHWVQLTCCCYSYMLLLLLHAAALVTSFSSTHSAFSILYLYPIRTLIRY
jgi:hypothetical protein